MHVLTFRDDMWTWNTSVCQGITQRYLKKTPEKLDKTFLHPILPFKNINQTLNIYLRDNVHDRISERIKISHKYEENIQDIVYKLVKNDPEVGFIDIGAHIGSFALQMAALGRRVIATEVDPENVRRMCASIVVNQMYQKLSIIHNSLDSRRGLKTHFVRTESGRFQQIPLSPNSNVQNVQIFTHNSIQLDDILYVHDFLNVSKVFIKMEANGLEHNIIEGTEKLFEYVKVEGIFMKWGDHGISVSGDKIKNKMKAYGFSPFLCDNVTKTDIEMKEMPCKLIKNMSFLRSNQITHVLWMPSRWENIVLQNTDKDQIFKKKFLSQ